MLHLEARSLRESIHGSTQRTVGFAVYFFPGNNRVSLYVLIHAALCDDQIPGKFLCQEKKTKKHFSHQKNKNPLDQIRLRSNISLHLYRP